MIVFIRSNPVVSDPRVEKEVQSLTTHGFKVTVLAWDREGRFSSFESSGDKIICRLRLCAPYGKLVIAAYYPLFWLWALSKLLRIRPAIVHACDLDSIFPALLFRLLKRRTKVIFDVFDTCGLLVESKSKLLGRAIKLLELLAASKSDGFITVSKERLLYFSEAKLKLVEIIMNCPSLSNFPLYLDQPQRPAGVFRIVYTGIITSDRGLMELAEATKAIDNIEFLVAGRVMNTKILSDLIRYPHVKYVGQLKYKEALRLEGSADIIPILYDLRTPIHRVSSPNKLFEAMMLGVPIITNLAFILDDVQCGIKVNYNDITEIRDAVLYFKEHPLIRRELGLKGRSAFEHKYRWSLMERRLLRLYHQLLTSKRCVYL